MFYLKALLVALIAGGIGLLFHFLTRRGNDLIERLSCDQAQALDNIPVRYIDLAILGSAAVSLFLELAVIRWQGEMFPIFSFYKNYSLLTCFAGLGLGYALARREAVPLLLCLPVLVAQFFLLTALRYKIAHGAIWAAPFVEQMTMGLGVGTKLPHILVIHLFLATVFVLTALAFIPIGQLCGRVMIRRENLRAYGFNLLGSLLGVILVAAVSFFWTPPVVWFCLCFAALLLFQGYNTRVVRLGSLTAAAGVVMLSWPVSPGYERLHTPYQLLERGPGEKGLTQIQAAGLYYQRVHDLSMSNANRDTDPSLRSIAAYYEFPYLIHGKPLQHIAIVGAGTGNDVAAALRCGAGRVDAIEIDPGIMMFGAAYHPEGPYADARVNAVVNDARSFLRTTPTVYDMIVYGLLDSHTLLSHASSVRLDSFVYTVEALREARQRLKENGILSLSFCVISDELGRKIYLMMNEAFEGKPPVCIRTGYDNSVIFLQSRKGVLSLNDSLLTSAGFEDITKRYANPEISADVSTDDWPFFYMPRRVYPVSYFGMLGLILLLSLITTFNFTKQKPAFSSSAFFFLGAGFMLVETKAITELGLTFGNTWQVIGIAISGILVMAFLANCAVQWFRIRGTIPWFLLLMASLLAGYLISGQGGFGASIPAKISTLILLTCPIFFSGMVFSSLLARTQDVAGAMAVNILGAMTGGVLEYHSMYMGFRFLYLLAIFMYALAILSHYLPSRSLKSLAS